MLAAEFGHEVFEGLAFVVAELVRELPAQHFAIADRNLSCCCGSSRNAVKERNVRPSGLCRSRLSASSTWAIVAPLLRDSSMIWLRSSPTSSSIRSRMFL